MTFHMIQMIVMNYQFKGIFMNTIAVILIVIFGGGNDRISISERFETLEQCESSYTAIKQKYGVKDSIFYVEPNKVNTKISGCVEVKS